VNLWGESPLYMNPVPSFYDGSESTSEGKGIIARWCGEGERKNSPLPD